MKSVMEWEIKMETQLPIFSAYDRWSSFTHPDVPFHHHWKKCCPLGFSLFFFPSCSESCYFPATSSTWLNREGIAEGLNLVAVTHQGFTSLYRMVQRRQVQQNKVSPKGEVSNKIQDSKLSPYRESTAELQHQNPKTS